ncbi:hypothetical protein Purlil1_12480 [Purpureocillium lilacinum]|uniref:Secreted protein n=1 Tax=Purpureocillium lilacinum TaxID=33203 RepID=A0ABR0BHC3_PURLI|nr:hypothetical protein Purlil1_12480 [Purpureocillium lilacinum]
MLRVLIIAGYVTGSRVVRFEPCLLKHTTCGFTHDSMCVNRTLLTISLATDSVATRQQLMALVLRLVRVPSTNRNWHNPLPPRNKTVEATHGNVDGTGRVEKRRTSSTDDLLAGHAVVDCVRLPPPVDHIGARTAEVFCRRARSGPSHSPPARFPPTYKWNNDAMPDTAYGNVKDPPQITRPSLLSHT